MVSLKTARVVVGVLASVTLMGLLIAEAVLEGATLKTRTLMILLTILSATLAVDIISQELPMEMKITVSDEKNE